jgi:anti-sigma-K factor RskA
MDGSDLHVIDQLPAYVLGALDDAEATEVRRHLSRCRRCLQEAEELQEVSGLMAFAAPDVAPPPELKGQLITRVRGEMVERSAPHRASPLEQFRRLIQRSALVWTPISVLLIIGLLVGNLLLWQRLSDEQAIPRMQTVPMAGTDASPGATGLLAIGGEGIDGTLVVEGLAPLNEDQQYQLWLIQDGQRDSGAVFSVDEQGQAFVNIDAPHALDDYSDFGITVEPAGGSPAPTGPKVLGVDL